MFVYEKDNKINIVLKGNMPVEAPDVVVGEGADGKAEVIINGKKVTVEAGE